MFSNKLLSFKRRLSPEPAIQKVRAENDVFYISEFAEGRKNFLLFQKYPAFRWPGWVKALTDSQSSHFRPFVYPLLVNTSMRDSLSFSNYISKNRAHIDSSGMIYPSYAPWAVELWLLIDGVIQRPGDNPQKVKISRSVSEGTLQLEFRDKDVSIDARMYGARTSSDEAFFSVKASSVSKKPVSLLLVLRPYNGRNLGGVHSIDFNHDTGIISVNGRNYLAFPASPHSVFSGSGGRDIDPEIVHESEKTCEIKDESGLACFAASYPLSSSESFFNLRISIDSGGAVEPHKIDFDSAGEIFSNYHSSLINKGINITLKDELFNNWFYALKSSVLNFCYNEIKVGGLNDYRNIRERSSAVWALTRMGYPLEAASLFNDTVDSVDIKKDAGGFEAFAGASWILKSAADYFICTRDVDFISEKMKFFSGLASVIFNFSEKIKITGDLSRNTIDESSIPGGHFSDMLPAASALDGYAYMARTLGLFGEELKYSEYSKKLQEKILEATENPDENDSFYCHYSYAGYPFELKLFTDEKMKTLIRNIRNKYGDGHIFVKSSGVIASAEISLAVNELLSGDPGGTASLYEMMESRKDLYQMPALYSPVDGASLSDEAGPVRISALFFGALRSMIFYDTEERLTLFPSSIDSWFMPGMKFSISDAPSRFGSLNFSVNCSGREVQISFDDIPKFIPPDVMINLPFKAKLNPGDDFIIKKETDSSFIINGWPSMIKFTRK